jgi:DNA-binding Xre family transcriptional regulator
MKAQGWFKKEYQEAKKSFEYKLEGLEIVILEKIAEVMGKKRISKSDLAQKLGVTKQAITNLFKNGSNITLKRLLSIANVLDCEVEINIIENNNYISNSNSIAAYLETTAHISTQTVVWDLHCCELIYSPVHNQTEISQGWDYPNYNLAYLNATQSTDKQTSALN